MFTATGSPHEWAAIQRLNKLKQSNNEGNTKKIVECKSQRKN